MKVLKLISEECNNLIFESNEQKPKDLYISGIFSTAELENINGRKYKKCTLSREVNKIMPVVEQKRQLGELNHPSSYNIDLNNVAIMIENLSWDKNNVMGRAYVLETPKGDIVRAVAKKGQIGISSRRFR